MFGKQRLSEQRIIAKVNHAGTEVVASAPVCVHFAKLFGGESQLFGSGFRFASLSGRHGDAPSARSLGAILILRNWLDFSAKCRHTIFAHLLCLVCKSGGYESASASADARRSK